MLDISQEDLPPFIPSERRLVSPDLSTPEPLSKRARVDEVDDEEAGGSRRWVQEFDGAAEELGEGNTLFDELRKTQEAMCEPPIAPFADEEEWELARWLLKNVTQTATEEFLKMKGVCCTSDSERHLLTDQMVQTRDRFHPSYKSNYTFLKKVDKLPTGAEWRCKMVQTVGELLDENDQPIIEEHELWIRNPVECISELIGNPAFRDYTAYAPEKTYSDKYGRNRRYDEMWTGDWWWTTQVSEVPTSTQP
jgi:hypothetical protein